MLPGPHPGVLNELTLRSGSESDLLGCWLQGSRWEGGGTTGFAFEKPRHSLPAPVAAHLGAACFSLIRAPLSFLSPTTEHPVRKHLVYLQSTSLAECQGTDSWHGEALGDTGKSVPLGRVKAEAWGDRLELGFSAILPENPSISTGRSPSV